MKESLSYINTNIECGENFLNNTNDYMLRYIKHLPNTKYFRRAHIDFEKILKNMKILF